MNWFEQRKRLTNITCWPHPKPTDYLRGFIRQNITKEIRCQNDIKILRVPY
jgi:hypothetical protein